MVIIKGIWIFSVSDFNYECFKACLSNCVAKSLTFRKILGPLVFGWAPNCIVLEAQLAPEEKRLVYIPVFAYEKKTALPTMADYRHCFITAYNLYILHKSKVSSLYLASAGVMHQSFVAPPPPRAAE